MTEQTCAACPPSKVTWQRIVLGIGVIIACYFLLKELGLLSFSPQTGEIQSLGAIFAIGLVAAMSSCSAVVTGVVAAVSTTKIPLSAHFYFNFGRVFGFAGFGALIGLLGQVFKLSTTLNGFMVLAIAVLMMTLGAKLMNIWPESLWYPRLPNWLATHFSWLTDLSKAHVPFILGAATFFLPCGFTQSVQLLALASGNPLQASIITTVFALGTVPSLFGIGLATSFTSGVMLKRLQYGIGVLVVALGVANVTNGAALLGFSPNMWFARAASANSPTLVNGAQLVQMEASVFGYSPDVIEVVEDTPVRWEIYGGEELGCASTLVVPGLGIQETLNKGFNEFLFTPSKPGSYSFSCSMGMVRGTLIVHPQS